MSGSFESVLVANRGEIAVRIIRTLRRLGIRSVAVYSDADRGALHVQAADTAIWIGPASPSESYLNASRILDAAAATDVTAVHPGYGFLSENASFAQSCADAGVVFVGPSPRAIDLMGDKIRAKLTVAAAGVPVVPGRAESGMSDDDLIGAAEEIGYPVLVKPSAGGGGKGMRLVESSTDLRDALAGARREALASFGDGTLFVEKFVTRPRHIEVQVIADRFGATLSLGERECSLQRRHQKVIEEAPSPLLDAVSRERLDAAAIATARSVDYEGVGTVEFIVASDQPDEFFFMEMNTRLQVEHPVTELVTGLDLVEQQLRIAAGERLSFAPEEVRPQGHAVEARVYAEDPRRSFLPTGGHVLVLQEPTGEGVRVDSSLFEGLDIATSYDPMLSKVIAWGPDRSTALGRLLRALSETVVLGVVTNVEFLAALVANPDVAAGQLDTGLIEREIETLVGSDPTTEAYAGYALARLEQASPYEGIVDLWDVPSGWRLSGHHPLSLGVVIAGDAALTLRVLGTPREAELRIGDEMPISVRLERLPKGALLTVAGVTHRAWTAAVERTTWVSVGGQTWAFTEATPGRRRPTVSLGSEIRSPMPGKVIEISASEGEDVRAGQIVMVVEAMKMEHQLSAPQDGMVHIAVQVGEAVSLNEVLARVESVAEEAGEPPSESVK